MTLPRAFDLMEAWGASPPVHWMIAAKLGIGSKKEESKATEADWEALAAAMGTTITRTTSNEPGSE